MDQTFDAGYSEEFTPFNSEFGEVSVINEAVPGKDGGYYIPTVSDNGNLSWLASDPSMPSVDPVNIAGPPGADGKDGKDGYTPVKNVDYFDGKDGETGQAGYTPIKGIDYFDGKDGRDGRDGLNGKDGYTPVKGKDYFDGEDGYTPQKGIDYFDGKDGRDGVDGKDGKDGYTPIKGVDYFDGLNGKDGLDGKNGLDGYTPIKGIDYFDGINGKDGQNGKDGHTPVRGTDYWTDADKKEMTDTLKGQYLPLTGGTMNGGIIPSGDRGLGNAANPWRYVYCKSLYMNKSNSATDSDYKFGMYQWNDNMTFTSRNAADNKWLKDCWQISGETGVTNFTVAPTVGGKAIGELVYPVGAVFIGSVSTNPKTLLGFGTWSQISQSAISGVYVWKRTA